MISPKCGQVFHGFLQTTDLTKRIEQPDDKISYAEFKDGGRWYRYRFRDFIVWRKKKTMTEQNKAEQDYMCEKMEGYCVSSGIMCCYAEIDDNGDVYCVLEKEDADNE